MLDTEEDSRMFDYEEVPENYIAVEFVNTVRKALKFSSRDLGIALNVRFFRQYDNASPRQFPGTYNFKHKIDLAGCVFRSMPSTVWISVQAANPVKTVFHESRHVFQITKLDSGDYEPDADTYARAAIDAFYHWPEAGTADYFKQCPLP
jgi:hypothetical protein